ncbi:LysR family transcriptional regulator [Streptomyces goshikiensis]|uniref:LysR family transcriptional regulator n=1 Tax=Streptomyces goshikiensis TaxID=1942 RepID=UPI001677BA0B|nr:LysR family transcriptional regulator [Streptomyces goshikiensis]GHD72547.1 LysR family transcriptional regulator [Streptomyces goshikiensis]
MIDVQRLRVLRSVAEHGSFSRAAAALLMTPSAVSQHIAALERSLGRPVAVRSTRGVTLTEPGRLLVETAETITAELDLVRREIDRLTERPRLTVATFTSGGRRLLPGALTRCVGAHPEVELTVLEAEPEAAVTMVRRGVADLALTYHFDGPPPPHTGLDRTPLTDDPLWLVLPDGHRLAGREEVGLGELASDRWVLGCLRTEAFLRRYAERAGFELRVAGSTTDYFFARTLVAAGVGVSLIPGIALAPESAGTHLVRVEPPRPARHIAVVTPRRRRPRPRYVEDLVEALVEAAGPAGAASDTVRARPSSPAGTRADRRAG